MRSGNRLGMPLSAQQVQIVNLLAQGLDNAEISAQLLITINTLRTQLQTIKAKTGALSRAHIVALAYQGNVLSLTSLPGPSQLERMEYVEKMIVSGEGRTLREMCGVSQAKIAIACGVPTQTVHRWEADQVFPQSTHLDAYYRVLTSLARTEKLPE
jgi:DNA-binding CsgD family transcriptional regulator/DNA-binding XRE family transcriptional regulator